MGSSSSSGLSSRSSSVSSIGHQELPHRDMGMIGPSGQAFMPPPGLAPPSPSQIHSADACRRLVKSADDISDDVSTCSESVTSAEAAGTTVIMQRIPNRFSHATLGAVLDNNVFSGEYDLTYVPIDFAHYKRVGSELCQLTHPN